MEKSIERWKYHSIHPIHHFIRNRMQIAFKTIKMHHFSQHFIFDDFLSSCFESVTRNPTIRVYGRIRAPSYGAGLNCRTSHTGSHSTVFFFPLHSAMARVTPPLGRPGQLGRYTVPPVLQVISPLGES